MSLLATSLTLFLLGSGPGRALVELAPTEAVDAATAQSLEEVIASAVRRDGFDAVALSEVGAGSDTACVTAAERASAPCLLLRAHQLGATIWLQGTLTKVEGGLSLKLEARESPSGRGIGSSTRLGTNAVALTLTLNDEVADVLRLAPRPSPPFEAPVALRIPLELVGGVIGSVAGGGAVIGLNQSTGGHCVDFSHDCVPWFSAAIGAAGAGAWLGTWGTGTLLGGHGSGLWTLVGTAGGAIPAIATWMTVQRSYGMATPNTAQAIAVLAAPTVGAMLGYELSAALRADPTPMPVAPSVTLGPGGAAFGLAGQF